MRAFAFDVLLLEYIEHIDAKDKEIQRIDQLAKVNIQTSIDLVESTGSSESSLSDIPKLISIIGNAKYSGFAVLDYDKHRDRIQVRCKQNHITWRSRVSSFTSDKCRKCKWNRRRRFLNANEVKSMCDRANVILLSEYQGCNKKALFQCKLCGYIIEKYVNAIREKNHCTSCRNKNRDLN